MSRLRSVVGIIPFLAPYWKQALASLALVAVSSLLGLLTPWPLKIIIDSVLSDHPLPSWLPVSQEQAVAAPPTRILLFVVLGGFLLVVLQRSVELAVNYTQSKLESQMLLDFRSALFHHAQKLSLSYHAQHRIGDLLTRINQQSLAIGKVALAALPLIQSSITLVGMLWVAYSLDAELALLSLVVVPFLYYSIGYYSRRIEPRVRGVRQMEADCLSIISDAFAMLRIVLAFGREEYEHRRFRRQSRQTLDARLRLTRRQLVYSFAVSLVTAGGISLVIGVGALHVLEGRLTVGLLLVIITYVGSVYTPLQVISGTLGKLQESLVDLTQAQEVLTTQPEIKDSYDCKDLPERSCGSIAFDRVSFSYDGRRKVLDDISFQVDPCRTVAIVGSTGAGKTTLASLLLRFYAPDSGRLLLDGRDVRLIRLASLRQQFSLVTQEPLLFSGTIGENIRYGRLETEEKEIRQAARAAGAHDFIMGLPQGYDTLLGERGANLSAGERQRISIARAFLKDAPILILDEPTSNLDSRTEYAILQALERLTSGRTTFMIAHRLSTIRRADLILVLDEGRLVESGSHRELLARRGLYHRFWERAHQDGPADAAKPRREIA